ncbi:MAG TPA: hypothetical protein PK869_07250, partial [Candidatus Hydrogenedentes bacterium]|nr:hypothetical protein [Candidatus Hydrogenedentota bacterium]
VQQEVESHFRQTVDAMLESGATLVAARTVALASLGKPGKARRRYRKTFHKPLEQRMLELDEKAWAQFHSLNFFGLEYMGLFCAVALCLFGIVALITPYEMTSVDLKLALIALAVAAACGALAIQLLKSKRRIRLDSLTLHERVYLTLQMAALGYGMFPFFHLMPIWSLLRESQVRSIDLFFCCIFGLIAVAYFGFSVRYWLASRRVLRQPKPHATG